MFFLYFLCFLFTSWSCFRFPEILHADGTSMEAFAPFFFSTMFFALQKHVYETGRNYFQGNFKSVFNTLSHSLTTIAIRKHMFTFISLSQIKILFPCHYGTYYCHYYLTCFPAIIDKLFSLLLDMFSLSFNSGIICIEMRISWELFMINA
jgi:hypothetical protein